MKNNGIGMDCNLITVKRKNRKSPSYRIFCYSKTFTKFIKNLKNRKFFIYTKNGTLFVNRKGIKGKGVTLFPYKEGCRVIINIQKEFYNKLKKYNGNKVKVVFNGTPKNIFRRYTRKEISAIGFKKAKKVLIKKYGKNYTQVLAKKSVINRRRLRSLFESYIIKETIESGIPAALWEPEIKEIKGVPDLLLIGKIIVEIVGYYREEYIKKLINKVNILQKSEYKIIIVAERRLIDKLKKLLPYVKVVSEKEYISWINKYAECLRNLVSKSEIIGDEIGIE